MMRVRFISGPSTPFAKLLNESLNDNQARKAMSIVNGEAHHAGIKFSDHQFPAPGSDDHAEEVARRKAEGQAHEGIHDPHFMKVLPFGEYPKPNMYDEIMDALKSEGFTDVDYDNNKAWRPEDNRDPNKVKKIGKVLGRKFPDLQKAHTDNLSQIKDNRMPGAPDPDKLAHHNTIKDNYVMRMARHPEEVYGMSADDHPWSASWAYGHGPDVAERHQGGYSSWDERFDVSDYTDYDQHEITDPDGSNLGVYHSQDSEDEAREHHAREYPVEEHDDSTEDEPKYHIPDHPDLSDKVYDDEQEAEDARNDWADENYDFEHPTRYQIYDNLTGESHYHDGDYEQFENASDARHHAEFLYDNDYENQGGEIAGNGNDGSCLSVTGGCYNHYLEDEVKQGTHALYLHHKDDKDFEQPLARIALRPYIGKDPESGQEHKVIRRSKSPSGFAHNFEDPEDTRYEALDHDGPFDGEELDQVTPTMQSEAHNLTRKMFPAKEGMFNYGMAPGVYQDPDGYRNHQFPAKMSPRFFFNQDPSIREGGIQDVHNTQIDSKLLRDIVKHKDASADDIANVLNYRGQNVKLDKATMKSIRKFTGRDAEKVNAAVAGHLRDFGHDKRNHAGVTNEDIEGLVNSKSDKVLMSLMTTGAGDPRHIHKARVHGLSGEQMNSDGMDDHHERTVENIDYRLQDRSKAGAFLGANGHGGYSNTGVLAPFAKQIAEKHAEVLKDDSAPDTLKGGFGFHPGFLARNPKHTDAIFDGADFRDHHQLADILQGVSDKKLASYLNGDHSVKVDGEDVDYHKIKGSMHDHKVASLNQVGRAARFLSPTSPVFAREAAPSTVGTEGFDKDDPTAVQKFADILKKDTHHGAFARQAAARSSSAPEIAKAMGDKSSAVSEAVSHYIENADFNAVSGVFKAPYRPDEFFAAHHTDAFAEKMKGLKVPDNEGDRLVNRDARLDRGIAEYLAKTHPDALNGFVRHNPIGAMQEHLKSHYSQPDNTVAKAILKAVMHPESGVTGPDFWDGTAGVRDEWVKELAEKNPDIIDDIMKQGKHPGLHAWHEFSEDIEHPALIKDRLPNMTPAQLAQSSIKAHLGGKNAARDAYAGEINLRHVAGKISPVDSLQMSTKFSTAMKGGFGDALPTEESPSFRTALRNHGPANQFYKDGTPVRSAQSTKDLLTSDLRTLTREGKEPNIEHTDDIMHLSDVAHTLQTRSKLTGNIKSQSHALDVLGYTRAHDNFLTNVKNMQVAYGEDGGGYGRLAKLGDHKKMIDEGHYDNRPAGISSLKYSSSNDRVDLYKHLHSHQSKTMGDAGAEANKQIVDHMVHEYVHSDPEIGKWQHGILRGIKGNDGSRGSMSSIARKNIMASPHFGEEDAKWMDDTKPEEGHFMYGRGMKGSDPRHIGNALPTSAAGWDYLTKGMTYAKGKDNKFPSKDGGLASREDGHFDPEAVAAMQAGAAETKWKGMEDRHHKAFAQYAHDHMLDEVGARTPGNMSFPISHQKAVNHFGKLMNETSKDDGLTARVRRDISQRQESVLRSATRMNELGAEHGMDKDMLSDSAKNYFKSGGTYDHSNHLSNDHAAEVIDHIIDHGAFGAPSRDLLRGVTENMAKRKDLKHEHKSAMVKAMQEYHDNAGERELRNAKYGAAGVDNLHKSLMDNGHQDLHDKILDAAPNIAHQDLIKDMSNEEFDRHADRVIGHLDNLAKKGTPTSKLPIPVLSNFPGRLPGTVDKLYNKASDGGTRGTNFDDQAARHGSPETAIKLADDAAKVHEAESNPHLQPHHADQLLNIMKAYNRGATSLHAHDNSEIRHKAMEHELHLHEKDQENSTNNSERRTLAREGMKNMSRVGLARHAQGKAKGESYAPSKEHMDRLVDHHIDSMTQSASAGFSDTVDPSDGMNDMGRHMSNDHINKILDHKADNPTVQRHVRQSGAVMALKNPAAMEDKAIRQKTLSALNNSAPYIGGHTINKMDLSNPKAAEIMAKHMVHRVVGDGQGFGQEGYVVNQDGEAVGQNTFADLKVMLKNHAQSGLGGHHVANAILKHPAIEASHPTFKGNLAAHAVNESLETNTPVPQHVKDTLIKHFPTSHHVESFELANKDNKATANFGAMSIGSTGMTSKDVSRNLEHIADPNHPLHDLHPEGVRKNLERVVTPLKRDSAIKSGSLGHPLLPKESVKLVPPKHTTDLMHVNPHQTSAQFDHHFKQGQTVGYGGLISKSKHFSSYHVDKVIEGAKAGNEASIDGLKHVARNAKITHDQAHQLMTADEEHTPKVVHNLRTNTNTPASFLREHSFYPPDHDHPAYSDPDHGHHLIADRKKDGGAISKIRELHPEAAKRYEQEYGGGDK